MRLLLRSFYRIFAIALLLAASPWAREARADNEASAFIAQLGQQATRMMTDDTLPSAERVERFGAIVDRDFDIPKIAQFMLGRYWQNASATERDDFRIVFRDYMIRVYSDNFVQYRSDTFHVIDQRATSDTMTIVKTSIVQTATGEPMIIEWRVVTQPAGFKVLDLSVGDVSLAVAQQEQFAAAIQRNGGQVSMLVKMVRSKLTQMQTAGQ